MEELTNIKTHIEMMLDDEMKKHCGFCHDDDLHMQIFRILQGYRQALTDAANAVVDEGNK